MSVAIEALKLLPLPLRVRIIRAHVRIDDSALAGVRVQVADNARDIEGAAALVHDAYVRRGILSPDPSGVHAPLHQTGKGTLNLVAKEGDRVVGTMSLYLDTELLGLPMETIYGDEVAALRGQRRHLAELGALAVSSSYRRTGVLHLLNKLAYKVSLLCGVDDVLATVHPRIAIFYETLLLFEQIGEEKRYPGLNRSARAVALRLDLRAAPRTYAERWGHCAPGYDNPYWFYRQRDPRLRVPDSVEEIQRTWPERGRAMIAMAHRRARAAPEPTGKVTQVRVP